MSYDMELERIYHPENFEGELDVIMNADVEALRRRILGRFTVGQIENELFRMDMAEELSANDSLIKQQHDLLLQAELAMENQE